MNIQELEKLQFVTKDANINYMVHGTWTGLSQGHTHNCYGFEQKEHAESYAAQLNIKNNWENETAKYIVTKYKRG